ncbi:hypothetical protein ACVIGB_008291 [Bradyrhizobium sp. USDA 4341]
MYDNFVRSHQTLRVTPAMATGVTDKLWEMEDLVVMLEQWALANFKPEYQWSVLTTSAGGILSASCDVAARSIASSHCRASTRLWNGCGE